MLPRLPKDAKRPAQTTCELKLYLRLFWIDPLENPQREVGEVVLVDPQVIKASPFLAECIKKGWGSTVQDPLQLQHRCTKEIYKKVEEYYVYHSAKGRSDKESENFNRKWGKIAQEMAHPLLIAANALQLLAVVHLASGCFAESLTGKSPEEIRDLLNLPDDLTEEEAHAPIDNPGNNPMIRMTNTLKSRLWKKKLAAAAAPPPPPKPTEDPPVDELVEFINKPSKPLPSPAKATPKKKKHNKAGASAPAGQQAGIGIANGSKAGVAPAPAPAPPAVGNGSASPAPADHSRSAQRATEGLETPSPPATPERPATPAQPATPEQKQGKRGPAKPSAEKSPCATGSTQTPPKRGAPATGGRVPTGSPPLLVNGGGDPPVPTVGLPQPEATTPMGKPCGTIPTGQPCGAPAIPIGSPLVGTIEGSEAGLPAHGSAEGLRTCEGGLPELGSGTGSGVSAQVRAPHQGLNIADVVHELGLTLEPGQAARLQRVLNSFSSDEDAEAELTSDDEEIMDVILDAVAGTPSSTGSNRTLISLRTFWRSSCDRDSCAGSSNEDGDEDYRSPTPVAGHNHSAATPPAGPTVCQPKADKNCAGNGFVSAEIRTLVPVEGGLARHLSAAAANGTVRQDAAASHSGDVSGTCWEAPSGTEHGNTIVGKGAEPEKGNSAVDEQGARQASTVHDTNQKASGGIRAGTAPLGPVGENQIDAGDASDVGPKRKVGNQVGVVDQDVKPFISGSVVMSTPQSVHGEQGGQAPAVLPPPERQVFGSPPKAEGGEAVDGFVIVHGGPGSPHSQDAGLEEDGPAIGAVVVARGGVWSPPWEQEGLMKEGPGAAVVAGGRRGAERSPTEEQDPRSSSSGSCSANGVEQAHGGSAKRIKAM